MFHAKKYFYFIIMICFLTTSLSFQYLWAEEALNRSPSNQQKIKENREQAPTQNQPQISIDSTHYNVGEVYEGDELVHAFTVRNTGKAQLNIKNVKAGWGCTIVSFDKTILSGQEGKVTLKVNTKNIKGKTKKSATIFSNDPQKPKTTISISGTIRQFISVEPSSRLLFKGYAGDKISKKVTITSLEEQTFEITDITSTIEDKIKYKLKTIRKGKEYSLEIKTRSGIKESFQGRVVLKTNSQKKPQLDISVMAKVQSEVKVSPQFFYFGIIDTRKEVIDQNSLTRAVMVNKAKGDDLVIEKIEPSSEWITTETETKQQGERYTVVIKLDKNRLPKGKFRENIKIHTKHKKTSEVSNVIIEGKVI